MSEGTTGLLVFGALCLICPVITHSLLRHFAFATFISVVATVVLFQLAAYLHLGHLDAFWIIAVITSSGMSLIASLIVGALVRKMREKSDPPKPAT